MKILVATAALATLTASPCLAQTVWQPGPFGYRSSYATAYDLQSYAPAPVRAYRRAAYRSSDVAPTLAFARAVPTALAAPTRVSASAAPPVLWGFGSGYDPTLRPSPRRIYDVFDTRNDYVGSDPDPNVRKQLAHDPTQSD